MDMKERMTAAALMALAWEGLANGEKAEAGKEAFAKLMVMYGPATLLYFAIRFDGDKSMADKATTLFWFELAARGPEPIVGSFRNWLAGKLSQFMERLERDVAVMQKAQDAVKGN